MRLNSIQKLLESEKHEGELHIISEASMQMKYAVSGLGNTLYRFYNSMARLTDDTFLSRGAKRIGG